MAQGLIAAFLAGGLVIGAAGTTSRARELPATLPSTRPAAAGEVDARKLIEQLGDADYRTREEASEALYKQGKAALPALREAQKSNDPEVKARAEVLVARIESAGKAPPADDVAMDDAQGGLARRGGGRIHVAAGQLIINNNVSQVRIRNDNGNKTIEVVEDGRKVNIRETPEGAIDMSVTKDVNGKEVTEEFKAKTAAELKEKNPEAHALYDKYNNGQMGNIRIMAGGGIQIQGGMVVGGGGVAARAGAARAHRQGIEARRRALEQMLQNQDIPERHRQAIEEQMKRMEELDKRMLGDNPELVVPPVKEEKKAEPPK